MRLRCPHCQSPIEVVDLPSDGEVTCAGCGSSFQLASLSTATCDGPTKKRIGKFDVLSTVGHGAFGTVLKAHDTELDRFVAIKVPRATNVGPGPEDVDRFLREARAVAQLRFPSIVAIHEVGTENGLPYLVSDFVEGITLADHLTGRGFSFTESAKLLAEVADALQYAHWLGVVHRDVKPSNIMIRPDGSPCVMDFGLAKRDAGEITMTIDGQILGTPAYMSPEQARGEGHRVDGRSDVYSLGVILYQLLTSELPFRGNKAMLLHQVLREEPLRPRALNDKIPRDLETIALKAMAKEPARRYASARKMAEDLRRWLAGEPILARPVGSMERTWRWCKRKPALATANAAVVVTLLTFVMAFLVVRESLKKEQIERGKAEEHAKANRNLADDNKKLAAEEKTHRVEAQTLAKANKQFADEADALRDRAVERALRLEFEHYLARADDRPELAFVGLASLLPVAARLKDPALAESFRLQIGAWSQIPVRLTSIQPHQANVGTVAISADGKLGLSGSYDKTARLWDTATGKQIGPPLQHQGEVWSVALSADGKVALTGSQDRTARLWDTSTGQPIGGPLQHELDVWRVTLSADGKVALTGSNDKTARLWDARTGQSIGPPLRHLHAVVAVALDAEGKIALTGSGDKTARVWDTRTGTPIGPPLQHQGAVGRVALSVDGKVALTGSSDGTARLWDTANGKMLKMLGASLPGRQPVTAVALSPDGKVALTESIGRTAQLWLTATGNPIGPPLRHQDRIRAVALSADGTKALTASVDKTAQIWDAATGKPIGPPLRHENTVNAVALSADGKVILTVSADKMVRLWSAATSASSATSLRHQGELSRSIMSPDGKLVLTGAKDKAARLWDASTGRPIGAPLQHKDVVTAVALSADGFTALTGSKDRTARLWKTATGESIGPPLLHENSVVAVALSADGKLALTGGLDLSARLWNGATGAAIGTPMKHQNWVVAVALSADGKIALTGGLDKVIRLWDTSTFTPTGIHLQPRPIGSPLQREGIRFGIAMSANGKTVLYADQNTARLWDTATGKPIGPVLEHQDAIRAVAVSANGTIAITGSADNTARLWDATTGKPIGPPLQHQDWVDAVALSADGKTALTGSADKTARLWETATGRPIGPPLYHEDPVMAVALSADGKRALTDNKGKGAFLWKVPQATHGDPERIVLWAQVITGLEVDELTAVRVLDAATWQQRRQRLQELGGPPTHE